MICGSFAKTLTPGIRLGWVEAGRWRDTIATHKRLQGAATNVVLEEALADLLTQGSYEAHLRRLSTHMRQRRSEARHLIAHHFPQGTRVSNPPSGDTLWLELSPAINCMDLFRRCASEGITFGPGELFTATDRYRHCLRLNFSGPWNAATMQALARIGEIARQMLDRPANSPTPPLLRRA
jgi:DNA-binding transcriptional MocR family regulator